MIFRSPETIQLFSIISSHFGDIDKSYPIDTRAISSIVDRIHEQYPFVDRTTVVFVVKKFFEVFREQLFVGNSVTVESCILNAHVVTYKRTRQQLEVKPLKVKVNTPRHLR